MATEIAVSAAVPRINPAAERQSRRQINRSKKRAGKNLSEAAADSSSPEVNRWLKHEQ
jgi:hypothetical protein